MQTPHSSDDELVSWPDVVRHVGSELSLREVELCTLPKPGRPLATLRFARTGQSDVRIALWALDPAQVLAERTLELEPVPPDARLLSLAVAADELLAANLPELERRAELARARPAPRMAGPQPTRPAAEPRALAREVGVAFVGDVFAGGQQLLGADLRLAVRFAPRWAATLRAGPRQGLPTTADHGTIETSARVLGAGLRFEVLTGPRLRLDLLARLDGLAVSATAYSSEQGTVAQSASHTAIAVSGGVGLRSALSRRLRLMLDGTVGGVPYPVTFTDTGRGVTGVSGLALGAGGGVLVAF